MKRKRQTDCQTKIEGAKLNLKYIFRYIFIAVNKI